MNIGDIVETTHEAPTAPSTPSSRLQPSVSPPLTSATRSTRALQQQNYHLPLPVREVLTRAQILLNPRPPFLPPQIISSQCISSIPPTASSSQTSARPTTQSLAPSWTQRVADGVPTHEDLSLSMSWSHPRSHFRVRPVRAACGSCRKRKSKCDGVRPSCTSCILKATPCLYSAAPGLTQYQTMRIELDSYEYVLSLLRDSTTEDAEVLIKMIKARDSLADAIRAIQTTRR